VADAARRHGALPLLAHHLEAVCPGAVPSPALRVLRERRRRDAWRALALAAELVRVLEALAARGVRAVALKGPALGAALYGDLTLRPCRDLDVLVPEAQLPDAERLLGTFGYLAKPSIVGPRGAPSAVEWERVLWREDDIVELHARLSPSDFAFGLDGEALWDRLARVRIGGRDVPTLGDEDLLLYLCAHGARHRWWRLEWIADVAELVRSRPGLDWDAVLERATRLGGVRLVLLGLTLAADVLDAPVGHALRARARADRVVPTLAARMQERLFEPGATQPAHGPEWLRWCAGVRERARDQWRCAWRIVLRPGPADWAWIRLPQRLAGLYYLTRPMRLGWKYLGGRTRAMTRQGS
jgi:hypothetical protein